jgi:hypothetical protein
MKMILTVLLLNLVTGMASAESLEFCGQAGETLFNPREISECFTTKNTCETQTLKSVGWLPSANGNCGPAKAFICGYGGPMMTHPQDASLRVQALSTCDTHALQVMGWVIAE